MRHGRQRLLVTDGENRPLIDSPLADLKHAWKSPLAWD